MNCHCRIFITHEEWLPKFGAFQTRKHPIHKVAEARHILDDFYIKNSNRICEEIYECYNLLPTGYSEDTWIYFR
jgi:hypothetical protein